MDEMRSIEPDYQAELASRHDEPVIERPPEIGTDERRMHVRAYNFWVSMLGTRAYPSIEDLDPEHSSDFGPHSVLLDFTAGIENPAVTFLGKALRRECGIDFDIGSIADVPSRSLLSRLTDHYLQILANRAPIGFEAEFVSQRGFNTLYRGILMPFSSDDDTIDFVYGVINWKELVEPDVAAELVLEVEQAMSAQAVPQRLATSVWADGPSGGLETELVEVGYAALDEDEPEYEEEGEDFAIQAPVLEADAELADHLAAARELAEKAQGARLKSRAALYRALGLAYDFALVAETRPDDYADLLADAGVKAQARAPMTAIVKLVFGTGTDKARATEFAAALSQARRIAIEPGRFAAYVEAQPGGLKALVAAERAARRPADALPSHADLARAALRKAPAQAMLDLASDAGEFVLLLARRQEDGRLAVLAPVPAEQSLVDRAIRKITR
ncbi:MAG: hypothetical protein JWO65_2554 [Sphingomonas bacterium]|nr:hypothetical protein [Sphingomonas bacterium]